MSEVRSFVLPVEEDPITKDILAALPREFLQRADWRAADVVQFVEVPPGVFELVNVTKRERDATATEQLPLFIVETIISHRMRFAVRAASAELAQDAVVQQKATEFDQNFLGEQLFSLHEVTEEQYLAQKPDYLSDIAAYRMIHTVEHQT